MENEKKVFSSNIIRCNNISKNNLYDILNIVPVQPLAKNTTSVTRTTNHNCNFVPKCDKFYIPKKKNYRKVKTVRDIRNAFERDVYNDLPDELEKQKNILLRKIRFGSSRDNKTKEMANNMLKSDNPMSKSTWQMLMNINPEEHKFSTQYIVWKGKCIQINGSKGGQNKFICKYDVEKDKQSCCKKSVAKNTILTRKRRLLHHSLNIKFKPGPLSKKRYLDTSYQKYHFGEIELVSLPQPGLEIQTSYGKPLAPAIDAFLHKSFLQDGDGSISPKWAMFAVSVLGKVNNGIVSQISDNSCVTFDLKYKCFQHRLLMRHDSEKVNEFKINDITKISTLQEEESIISEVRNIMDRIIDTVEISLKQDEMYSGTDDPREITIDNTFNSNNQSINKNKRKFGELDRLDVTVIRISDSANSDKSAKCKNDYCSLGCVCDSLKCSYNLKRHCGQIECMFKCKCDFSNYKYKYSFDNDHCDIIPGLINLDKKLGQTMAKEEHKFHQTVIVTDERSILLKSDKRNWKTSKKYADFYSNMHLKSGENTTEMLSIVCVNLHCKNIEPWCMVHNLYKCFCKGKFTETIFTGLEEMKTLVNEKPILNQSAGTTNILLNEKNNQSEQDNITHKDFNENHTSLKTRARYSMRVKKYAKKESVSSVNESSDFCSNYNYCARILPYKGRKYYNSYYHDTNKKILEMEKNDNTLQKKLIRLLNKDNESDINILSQNTNASSSSTLKELLSNVIEHTSESDSADNAKRLPNKTKLVAWLERSYKQYRQRVDQGLAKVSLDPPKAGRLCLYSWEFVLSRYRERKNYFLISKQTPFRIFMAIDIKNSFFNNCTNISDINLSDIDNYPITVKNLLTNATDLKENFCILCGLSLCWELIGSVTKITESRNSLEIDNRIGNILTLEDKCPQQYNSEVRDGLDDLSMTFEDSTEKPDDNFFNQVTETNSVVEYNLESLPFYIQDGTDNDSKLSCKEKSSITCNNVICDLDKLHTNIKDVTSNEVPKRQELNNTTSKQPMSKWFVMKVENDFTEIQFYRKGFFVKYESVVKAINVARVSNKTVRLSSQKCSKDQNDPQFGIYAIPSNKEFCVFIGPYEKDENLGIEAIKKVQNTNNCNIPQTRTRGIWILTNKVDNLKVIDSPLLFISSSCLQNDKMVTLESDSTSNYNIPEISCTIEKDKICESKSGEDTVSKLVKPIKIRKTNGFYHLTTNGYLKPIQSPEKAPISKTLLLNTNVADFRSQFFTPPTLISPTFALKQNSKDEYKSALKPIAEIAPQIKECNNLDANGTKIKNRRMERGMFVLNPEEINKRSIEQTIAFEQLQTSQQRQNVISDTKCEISMDIENFLATSVICTPPKDEVYVISDDDNGDSPVFCTKGENLNDVCKNVWIICKNVQNLGWIAGQKNYKNYLSFEFPGFKSSEFYPENDALNKISQIFARKVYVPRHIELEWHIVESEADIKTINKLEAKYLCADYILTKSGLRHKFEVEKKIESLHTTESQSFSKITETDKILLHEELIKEKNTIMNHLEETSKTLEDESSFLWNKTLSNQGEILESFSVASEELRKELTKQLSSIKSESETVHLPQNEN